MPKIAVQPHILKDVLLTIATDDYAKHVDEVQFVPSTKTEQITWHGLSPDASFSDAGTPETTWLLNLSYAQDWATTNSLSEYLLANKGQTKTVVFQPKAGTGQRKFTAEVTIVPGPIGGKGKAVATGTVSLPVNGDPVPGTTAP